MRVYLAVPYMSEVKTVWDNCYSFKPIIKRTIILIKSIFTSEKPNTHIKIFGTQHGDYRN